MKRLNIRLDAYAKGLWSSEYHLIGMSPTNSRLSPSSNRAEDIPGPTGVVRGTQAGAPHTPLRPRQIRWELRARAPVVPASTAQIDPKPGPGADEAGASRRGGSDEAEVRSAVARREPRGRDGKRSRSEREGTADGQGAPRKPAPRNQPASSSWPERPQGGTQPVPQAQGRKGQPGQSQGAQPGGQRYGTTRLRISVAGKYTEATVANGKIVVAGRSFDSPDQAAAELTKSRGDWTFWEYYDSTDGKWRMLTRDWDTVLKSAAPGGR